jgi:hypothetical protein
MVSAAPQAPYQYNPEDSKNVPAGYYKPAYYYEEACTDFVLMNEIKVQFLHGGKCEVTGEGVVLDSDDSSKMNSGKFKETGDASGTKCFFSAWGRPMLLEVGTEMLKVSSYPVDGHDYCSQYAFEGDMGPEPDFYVGYFAPVIRTIGDINIVQKPNGKSMIHATVVSTIPEVDFEPLQPFFSRWAVFEADFEATKAYRENPETLWYDGVENVMVHYKTADEDAEYSTFALEADTWRFNDKNYVSVTVYSGNENFIVNVDGANAVTYYLLAERQAESTFVENVIDAEFGGEKQQTGPDKDTRKRRRRRRRRRLGKKWKKHTPSLD